MIVPSIDILGGRAVQLEGGEALRIDAGDPRPLAADFSRVGEIAVIDLDAARGEGDNRGLVEELAASYPCRVGGGIRDYETAARFLDAGARKVILGTAAEPGLLARLPRDRVIVALDARDGEVVVEGWRRRTGFPVVDRMRELAPYSGGFLVTTVEREGRMSGADLGLAADIVQAARECREDLRVTWAGGVTTAAEVAQLDRLGADAQVGMALYTGRLSLAEALTAPLVSDRMDGLWPVLVCDTEGVALGLVWGDAESVAESLARGRGVYRSRSRGLWEKGSTSGNTQELVRIDVDCDRDALRYTVRQNGGGFCHLGARTCFGPDRGLGALDRTIQGRMETAPEGSYTRRLFTEPGLLAAKIREEAAELALAEGPARTAEEAADLVYFTLVKLRAEGASLSDIEKVLDRRSLKVVRRPGDAKPAYQEE
ncbi:MAG TPA: phosphoribosyl-ATP diphosphatase, partial [Magnetospirillaceae bacterium]|nr:phosphoribosyl-ATP diphosphatase [Magnetospirillaceae bacterium]